MTKHKILVVDDEESLCEILQFNLEVEGYCLLKENQRQNLSAVL